MKPLESEVPSRKSGSEVQVQGEVTRLSSPRLICFTEAKKMMAVMENITKLVRANKFTLDTVPLLSWLSWFEDLVYTGLHSLHSLHISKSNAFTTSSHIQGRSLAILGNIHCQLSMVRIKAVCSFLQFAWCFLWWGALQSGRRRDQRCFWPSSWCLRQCAGGLDLSHAARGVPFL